MKNYSLPFSATGLSSAVKPPPWQFSMDCLLLNYEVDLKAIEAFVPDRLSVSPGSSISVQVAFCDGSCVSFHDKAQVYRSPGEVNYRECLVKLSCLHNNLPCWYVPISWVTNDSSLMRGFLMGFSKRIGEIEITNFHRINMLSGGRRHGSIIGARVQTKDGTSIYAKQSCHSQIVNRQEAGIPYVMRRHIPELTQRSFCDELVMLQTRNSMTQDIWTGSGEIEYVGGPKDVGSIFQPKSEISAISLITSFEVQGITSLD